jgi:sporulation protein YhbH
MVQRIDRDLQRFRRIVRGHIKKGLRKYMSTGELVGKKGKNVVSIPIRQIELPTFRHETRKKGGVGQGDGEPGQPIGAGEGDEGTGEAGDAPGRHMLEVDVTLEELAEIMAEELELPNIQPKSKRNIEADAGRYTTIGQTGPESLRHFKRTFKEALKRQIASGTYDRNRPVIIPVKEDRRYRARKTIRLPETNAVIVYIMDVSGSMGDEQKEIVRNESFWINMWLQSQYKGLETRYVIHDAEAHEVDEHTFFHTRESGGTRISSAYTLCSELIDEHYSPDEWNIYVFHFSDGDNWGGGDTQICLKVLQEKLLPEVNLFCYGQVASPYGSGAFIKDLRVNFEEADNLVLSEINSRDEIYDSIKAFLGKGK